MCNCCKQLGDGYQNELHTYVEGIGVPEVLPMAVAAFLSWITLDIGDQFVGRTRPMAEYHACL